MRQIIDKFNKMDIVAKASFVYILSGFFQRGISLISGPIFTRLLSQSDYGTLSSYNSWVELIGVIAMLSLSAGVYNNGLLEFNNDRDTFSFSLLVLSNIATLLVALVWFAFNNIIYKFARFPTKLIIIMFISFLFTPALTFWTTRQRYEYKYIASCIVTLVSSFLATFFSIIITYMSDDTNKLYNKIWTEKGTLLLLGIILYIYLAFKAKCKVNLKYWGYALKFNLPLLPHYLSNYVLNSVDRLMILSLVGAECAAIYSVSYSAAFVIQIFWSSINGAILPLTYESIKNKKEYEIETKVFPFIIMYGGLCVFISFIAPEVMMLLAPSSYQEGIYLIPILSIGTFLTGLYCLFANVEFYYKSTKFIAFNSTFSAVLNLALNYTCIKIFGYFAAAYTTMLCYFIQTFLHYLNYRKVSKKIYSDKKILILFCFVFIGCLICIPLYYISVLRYAIIFLSIVLLVLNRKSVANAFIKIKKEQKGNQNEL